jgi:hypothetical protein
MTDDLWELEKARIWAQMHQKNREPSYTATDRMFSVGDSLVGRAREIMKAKNHDYRGGSDDPYANFRNTENFGVHPVVGIMIRMNDKMMRIKTFVEKGELLVKGEGIDDALMDLINYTRLIAGYIEEEKRKADGNAEQVRAEST